jgi:uncharacterized repeat protein (TIGR02543 family)
MATTISVKVNKGQTYGGALVQAGANSPTRTGYIFSGWNTKADGTGETRLSNQAVVKSETIYAQWEYISLSVDYTAMLLSVATFSIYKNGELLISNPSNSGSFSANYGDMVYATATAAVGYTSPSITGVSTDSSNPTIITSSTILIKLTGGNPISNTLSFDFDGGSGSPSSKSVTYDSVIGTLPTPTKTGYNFTGWKIGSTTISSSTIWNYTTNQTAVAQWAIKTYTVDFDLDGGTRTGGGALHQIVNHGGAANPPTCTKSGYTFSGWSGSYTNVQGNRSLTAIWTANRVNNFISVEYISNKVRAVATYNVSSAVSVTLASVDLSKTGNSTISSGSKDGIQILQEGATDWYVSSLSPSYDDDYYYIY